MPDNKTHETGSDAKPAVGPAAAGAGVAASVALEKGIEGAIKVIEMIRDKEIRENVTNKFNAVRAEVFQAGYDAQKNYNDYRRKLKPSQRDKIQQMLNDADHKLQESLKELSDGAASANNGNEGAAKEHFEKAEKLGHEAAELFKKAQKRKHDFIAENAPNQPEEGGDF